MRPGGVIKEGVAKPVEEEPQRLFNTSSTSG
jgi:hypothetical protein